MKNGSKRTINNIVTILLMIVSIAVMFGGWITIADNYTRRSIQEGVEDAQDEMRDMDDNVVDGIDFVLERLDVPVSVNKVLDFTEKVLDILEDAALSPVETIKIGRAWASSDIGMLLTELEESDYDDWIIGKDVMRFLEGLGVAGAAMVVMSTIMIGYLVITVLALIRQLFKTNAKSIFFFLASVFVTIWNCVTVYVMNEAFSEYIEDIFDMDKLFVATFFSFVPAICAILVLINQFFVKQVEFASLAAPGQYRAPAVKNFGNGHAASRPAQRVPKASGTFCPACGTGVSKDAAFCPGCGAFIAKPEPVAKTCSGCGTVLDDDAVFCPNCGAKNE